MSIKLGRARVVIASSAGALSFLTSVLVLSEYFGGGAVGLIASLTLAGSIGLATHLLWPYFKNPRPQSGLNHETGRICPPGPHQLVAGDVMKLPLSVKRGDLIGGHLLERTNQCFNWRILDEHNYVRFLKGKKVNTQPGESEVPASKLNWRVPTEGPWFLIVSAPGKRIVREVEVQFRRVEPGSSNEDFV